MRQEDHAIPTRPFLNRREQDPYLKNVFPAGFCKNKHLINVSPYSKNTLEIAMPQVVSLPNNNRDFISVFKHRHESIDTMTDACSYQGNGRDEYADVAGPFFSETRPFFSGDATQKNGSRAKSLKLKVFHIIVNCLSC